MAKEKKYKVLKYVPIPEVAKPASHHKEKKRFIIVERYTKDYQAKKIKEHLEEIEKLKMNDWRPHYNKKYITLKDAENAMKQFLKQQGSRSRGYYSSYLQRMYEFQIKEINDEQEK
jgi:hypothetical protein